MKKYIVFALSFTLLFPAPSFSAAKKPAAKSVVKKPVAKKPIAKKVVALPAAKPASTPASTPTKRWIDEGDSCDPAVTKTVKGFPKGLFMEDWLKCDEKTRTYVGERTPTANPAPTPTANPAPTPIDLTWDNIAANFGEISTNVYRKYESFIDPNYQSKLKVNLFVGPNSKPNNANPSPAFSIASNLLRNFKQPEEVNAIYYSFLDKEWAKKTTQDVDGTSRWNYQFDYECTSESNCRGASAGMTQNWQAIGRFTVKNENANAYNLRMFTSGETEIHEFTHTVYMYQLKPNFNRWYVMTPSWFSEGHATFLGKLGGSKSLADYKFAQDLSYKSVQPDQTLRSYSPENILRFYDLLSNGQEDPGMKQYVYALGYSTVEALAAIGGVDSPMNLALETAKGSTFEQAFKTIYGIDWKVAAPILAEIVSKQYMLYSIGMQNFRT